MAEEKRSGDAGDAVREGVRSLVGVLGALKDAFEQSLGDLRDSVERKGERPSGETTGGPAGAGAGPDGDEKPPGTEGKDPVEAARETVEAVRDRFDFVTRKDLEPVIAAIEALETRVRALEEAAGPTASPAAAAAEPHPEPGPTPEAPEPPVDRPFRIHTE